MGLVPHGKIWTAEDDDLVRALPAAEVARQTGRTLTSVYSRRVTLGVEDGRKWKGRRLFS
jgi:hypothetical protein